MAKTHKRYSASAAYRWINCPATVRLTQPLPRETSAHAEEGTIAHTVADTALRMGRGPDGDFPVVTAAEQVIEGFRALGHDEKADQIDDEMISGVTEYCTYVAGLIDKYPDAEWEPEMQIEMDLVHPLTGGTTDFILFSEEAKLLHVVDFKYGKGKIVEPENNPQGMTYALGAYWRNSNRDIREVAITIVQPRGQHWSGETTRTWRTDVHEILGWVVDIQEAIARAEDPNAEPVAGRWCKEGFCQARSFCPAYQALAFEQASIEWTEADDGTLAVQVPMVGYMTPEQRAAVLDAADMLKDWIAAVQKAEHAKAEAGDPAPGWKLVPKRATRKFAGYDAEQAVVAVVLAAGKTEDEVRPRKTLSVAQMESLVGGKVKFAEMLEANELADAIEAKSSGTNLARDDDPRPAVTKVSADDELAEMPA